MEVPCPICNHPLNVGEDIPVGDTSNILETISGVNCPNCGFVPLQGLRGVDDPDEDCPDEDRPDRTISYGAQAGFDDTTEIGHFRLIRLLGHGGFGTVWLAADVNLERQVALKLPNSRNKDLSNLLHEAQAAAHLRHPNIVSIYEVGTEDGQVFIASEYIDGMTLRDLLTTGKPSVTRAVELTIAIAEALQHAHGNAIVHRDVKPANILLNEAGQPYVTDFGLAKRVSAQSTETTISSEGQILGTARYMSPEQASGKTRETDHRSDIYAIGVILFEMLTGHVPFRGNMRAVLQQKIFDDPPSPRSLDTTVPKDLETICLRCLERDPQKRYASAGEVAQELRRFREGEPILARPISRLERTWRWCRRRPMIAGLLLSLLTSLSVGVSLVSIYWLRAANNASLLRESLYRAQMTLASEYLSHGDIPALRHALNIAYDEQAAPDLRGFEWYYYNALSEPFVQIVNLGDLVDDVAVSADGNRLAAVDKNYDVRIWNTADGRLVRRLPPEAGRVESLAFSPLNNQLVTGSADGWVRFWNPMKSAEPIQQVKHGRGVEFICFSPNGRKLLTAASTGAVRLWDAGNLQSPLAEIPTGQSGVKGVEFSPDGSSIFVATADGRVRMRDVESSEIQLIFGPNDHLESFAVSDDGKTLVVATYEGRLRFWSTDDGTLWHKEDTHFGLIGDMVFLKDSPLLAIAGTSGQLVLYDVEQRHLVREVNSHYLTGGVLDRSADGRLLVVGSGEGSVKVLEIAGISQPTIRRHASQIRGMTFLDGRHLVAVSGDGQIANWNVNNGDSTVMVSSGDPTVTRMAGCAATKRIAMSTDMPASEPEINIRSMTDAQVLRTLPVHGKGVVDLTFSPSGDWLAIAERDGSVRLVNMMEENADVLTPTISDSAATALAFTSDRTRLIAACEDGTLWFIDPASGQVDPQTASVEETPRAIAFCPATDVIAIGTDTGMIYLVDARSRQLTMTIKAHTSRINAFCVLPNGDTLVSGGRDRTLRMWDTRSGEMLTSLFGHIRQVFCLAVSPDGQTLCSGDLEGNIRIWRAPHTN